MSIWLTLLLGVISSMIAAGLIALVKWIALAPRDTGSLNDSPPQVSKNRTEKVRSRRVVLGRFIFGFGFLLGSISLPACLILNWMNEEEVYYHWLDDWLEISGITIGVSLIVVMAGVAIEGNFDQY